MLQIGFNFADCAKFASHVAYSATSKSWVEVSLEEIEGISNYAGDRGFKTRTFIVSIFECFIYSSDALISWLEGKTPHLEVSVTHAGHELYSSVQYPFYRIQISPDILFIEFSRQHFYTFYLFL